MTQAGKERYDPFRNDDLAEELAGFQPKSAAELTPRPQAAVMKRIAAARGFEERPPVEAAARREPLKALQFRLPQSQVERFHQLAFETFGLAHGAKTALFLRMWEAYVKDAEREEEARP